MMEKLISDKRFTRLPSRAFSLAASQSSKQTSSITECKQAVLGVGSIHDDIVGSPGDPGMVNVLQ